MTELSAPRKKSTPKNRGATPSDWKRWLVSAAAPLALCALRLGLDLWNDEVYTLAEFVAKPWTQIVTDYSAPNNHIFYSLVLRPVYLYSNSVFWLRLPSLVFAAGTLAMTFRLVRRWSGLAAAMFATALLGLTQMYLVHAMQIRGHGLSMFLAAWLGDLAFPGPRTPPWSRLVLVTTVGALLLYTLPTNFLVLVPLAVTAVAWQCLTASRQGISPESVQGECGNHRSGRDALEELHRRENGTVPFVRTTARAMRRRGIEAAAWSGACLLAAALYFPVRAQLLHAGREAVAFGFLGAGSLAGTVLRDAVHDWLPILPAAIAGLALWVRRVSRQRSSDTWAMPLVALGGVLGPFVLAGLTGIWGFERVFCPILPFLMAVLGCLLAECLRRWLNGCGLPGARER